MPRSLQLWANCLAASLAEEGKPHLVRQARLAGQALDARGVLPAAQRWTDQGAAAALGLAIAALPPDWSGYASWADSS